MHLSKYAPLKDPLLALIFNNEKICHTPAPPRVASKVAAKNK
jgi:hypothetical protein